MLWGHGKPSKKVAWAIGWMDFDNMAIHESDRPFCHTVWSTGGMNIQWMHWMLDNGIRVLKSIGRDVELHVFVDLESTHTNAAREQIVEAARTRPEVRIIHVPAVDGVDQVDAVLIRNWEETHDRLLKSTPFVLFSEDAGFTGLLRITRQSGRRTYLFLPTNYFFPHQVQEATGWGWIDPDAPRTRALAFLLNNAGPFPRPEFVRKFLQSPGSQEREWWKLGTRALNALDDLKDPLFESEEACIRHLERNNIPEGHARTLLWYLVAYGVLILAEDHLLVNPDYTRRNFPLLSLA